MHGTQALRIEREQMLKWEHGVGEQTAHQTEKQHGQGIASPVLFLARPHAKELIGQPFKRTQDGIEPCAAVGVEHLLKVEADRELLINR